MSDIHAANTTCKKCGRAVFQKDVDASGQCVDCRPTPKAGEKKTEKKKTEKK
jgi:hypothetical protein